MRRLASVFDLHSLPDAGTVLLARLSAKGYSIVPRDFNLEFGAVSLPLDGEEVCGDHWAIKEVGGRTFIMVVDGLGHGLQAAEASREAIRVFQDSPTPEPADTIRAAHLAPRGTRGASAGHRRLDHDRAEIQFAGVGNIAGSTLDLKTDRTSA